MSGILTGSASERVIPYRFAALAADFPDEPALVSCGRIWTYRDINERANQLAWALIREGVTPERVVGVITRRDAYMAISALAVAKAGGAYLPLDQEYPLERLRYMMSNAQASLLAVHSDVPYDRELERSGVSVLRFDETTLGSLPTENPVVEIQADGLLYLIYTSGSTGHPKAIAMGHGPTVDLLDWSARHYAPCPVAMHYFPVTTDVAFFELFGTWWSGGAVVVATEDDRYDLMRLATLIRDHRVTKLMLPVVLLDDLAQHALHHPGDFTTVRELATTGDRLMITDAIRQFFGQMPGAILDNQYGSTEVNVVTVSRLDGITAGWPDIAPVGRPIGQARAYVLDGNLEPAPPNVPGSIYIGGMPLCRGYQGQAALTARAFAPDPFAGVPGARMYRTGDRGQWHPSGQLQCLGREDFQLKIHGYRVEPGEIEALLHEHPDVAEAVVAADDGDGPDKSLVAYVVPANGSENPDDLRRYLRKFLPALIVPQAFVFLPSLPLTGTGKVDRKRLPALRVDSPSAPVPPRNSVERAIAQIWSDVLDQEHVGIHDNFFLLGGHSLLVTQVIFRLRERFHADIPLRAIFDAPTVASLADEIPTVREASYQTLRPMPRTGRIPLSHAQQGLWFLNQLFPDSAFYNNLLALRIQGRLDTERLTQAFARTLARHEGLRTRFPTENGVPEQVIDPVSSVGLERIDLSGLPAEAREREVRAIVGEQELRPFDLAAGPLVRGLLVRLGTHEHVLAIMLHHIVSDARSLEILQRELLAEEPEQPDTAAEKARIQYTDYAIWQRQWLTSEALGQQRQYWLTRLHDAPKRLELITDFPRGVSFPGADNTGVTFEFKVDDGTSSALRDLSNKCQATLFMTTFTAFAVLLNRYTPDNPDDLVIGVPVEGRSDAAMESILGFFINSLALRVDWVGDPTFRDLVGRVREITIEAYANQDLPFDQLVEMLGRERDIGDNPIFQVMFQLQYEDDTWEAPGGLVITEFRGLDLPSKFDLSLDLLDSNGVLGGRISYPSGLFHDRTIALMADHFVNLLKAAVAQPDAPISRLVMTGDDEQRWLRRGDADPAAAQTGHCAHELVSAMALAAPGATAVIDSSTTMCYSELNSRANRLAHYLLRAGVNPEDRIGVCLERGAGLVVAMLAILKAGGAYLPLDPSLPAARLALVIEDAAPSVLLTSSAWADSLPSDQAKIICTEEISDALAGCPDTDPPAKVPARGLAYVIYTSGSTGRPKGVMIEHASLARRLRWMTAAYAMTKDDRVLMTAPMSFDVSLWEILAPLTAGAATVIPQPGAGVDELAEAIRRHGITMMEVVPSLLAALIEEPFIDALASLRHVICGSEVFPTVLARSASSLLRAHLYNSYGPTEATIDCTLWLLEADERGRTVPIGHAIAGARLYVLDHEMNLTPAGMPGELYIGGPGIGRGYLGEPALTAARFVPDPFGAKPGARLYRTGDIVRRRFDGELEYLTRTDGQLKVRGFRVEQGEVEAHLAQHPRVASAVVATSENGRGESVLTAYIVGTQGAEVPGAAEVRDFLRDRLPDYMIPVVYITLSELPLSPSGKVNRLALPAPQPGQAVPEPREEPPTTPVQNVVATVWKQVLGIPDCGIHTDFFALGGHSLLVPQVAARIADVLGVEVTPRALFELPTVAELASMISRSIDQGERTVAGSSDHAMVLERENQLAEQDSALGDLEFPAREKILPPRNILLTGAAGFVGAYLLAALLERTDCTIYCLLRGGNEADCAERLAASLGRIGANLPSNRTVAVAGDLSSPAFGMQSGQFSELAEKMDTVIHCAARVNAVLGYRHLRQVNVLGTRELLRLAAAGGAGSFHFVSTTSAGDPEPMSGYAASKRAAERLVLAAGERGLDAFVHRLERVTGATDTGIWNDSDLMSRIIRGSLEVGYFPELHEFTEAWTPVDSVTRLLADHIADPPGGGHLRTITAPPVRYQDVLAWIRSHGHRFGVVSPMDWVSAVVADPANPAYACAGTVLRAGTAPAPAAQAGPYPPGSQDTGLSEEATYIDGVNEVIFHRYLDRLASMPPAAGTRVPAAVREPEREAGYSSC